MSNHKTRDSLFWIMFGFIFGVFFIAILQGNYERPSKWENGATISHQGVSYKLQEVPPASGDK